jgi:hypothetical protein
MRYPSPGQVGAATALATMGALPLGQVPASEGPPAAYAIGSVGGAAVGGGLVGFVAAGDLYGAATGSLLTMGLAGLASSFSLLRAAQTADSGPVDSSKVLGVALGLGGLLGVGSAVYMAGARR